MVVNIGHADKYRSRSKSNTGSNCIHALTIALDWGRNWAAIRDLEALGKTCGTVNQILTKTGNLALARTYVVA